VGRHWRGQQNIIWSLLVNEVGMWVPMIAGAASLAVFAGVPERILAWGVPVFLVWFVWAVAGRARAAIATLRDPTAQWMFKLVAVVALVGLVLFILIGAYNDLPLVRRWLLGH
jgi:hypothetical protein